MFQKRDDFIKEEDLWKELIHDQYSSQFASSGVPASLLKESYAILFKIATSNWLPTTFKSSVTLGHAKLIYKIQRGLSIDLGQRIFDQLLFFSKDENKINALGIPFPSLIYQIMLSQGFRRDGVELEEILEGEQFFNLEDFSAMDAAEDRSLMIYSEDKEESAVGSSKFVEEN
jgi:hypothetical protein